MYVCVVWIQSLLINYSRRVKWFEWFQRSLLGTFFYLRDSSRNIIENVVKCEMKLNLFHNFHVEIVKCIWVLWMLVCELKIVLPVDFFSKLFSKIEKPFMKNDNDLVLVLPDNRPGHFFKFCPRIFKIFWKFKNRSKGISWESGCFVIINLLNKSVLPTLMKILDDDNVESLNKHNKII